jgi:hypothetical protein
LAFIVNQRYNMLRSVLVSGVLGLWILRCLWYTYWAPHRNVGRTVAGLLAAIPLVDLLSVWTGAPGVGATFAVFFILALLFQRYIPAT